MSTAPKKTRRAFPVACCRVVACWDPAWWWQQHFALPWDEGRIDASPQMRARRPRSAPPRRSSSSPYALVEAPPAPRRSIAPDTQPSKPREKAKNNPPRRSSAAAGPWAQIGRSNSRSRIAVALPLYDGGREAQDLVWQQRLGTFVSQLSDPSTCFAERSAAYHAAAQESGTAPDGSLNVHADVAVRTGAVLLDERVDKKHAARLANALTQRAKLLTEFSTERDAVARATSPEGCAARDALCKAMRASRALITSASSVSELRAGAVSVRYPLLEATHAGLGAEPESMGAHTRLAEIEAMVEAKIAMEVAAATVQTIGALSPMSLLLSGIEEIRRVLQQAAAAGIGDAPECVSHTLSLGAFETFCTTRQKMEALGSTRVDALLSLRELNAILERMSLAMERGVAADVSDTPEGAKLKKALQKARSVQSAKCRMAEAVALPIEASASPEHLREVAAIITRAADDGARTSGARDAPELATLKTHYDNAISLAVAKEEMSRASALVVNQAVSLGSQTIARLHEADAAMRSALIRAKAGRNSPEAAHLKNCRAAVQNAAAIKLQCCETLGAFRNIGPTFSTKRLDDGASEFTALLKAARSVGCGDGPEAEAVNQRRAELSMFATIKREMANAASTPEVDANPTLPIVLAAISRMETALDTAVKNGVERAPEFARLQERRLEMGQVVDITSELVACGEALSTSNAAHLGREQLWAAIARARAVVGIAPDIAAAALRQRLPQVDKLARTKDVMATAEEECAVADAKLTVRELNEVLVRAQKALARGTSNKELGDDASEVHVLKAKLEMVEAIIAAKEELVNAGIVHIDGTSSIDEVRAAVERMKRAASVRCVHDAPEMRPLQTRLGRMEAIATAQAAVAAAQLASADMNGATAIEELRSALAHLEDAAVLSKDLIPLESLRKRQSALAAFAAAREGLLASEMAMAVTQTWDANAKDLRYLSLNARHALTAAAAARANDAPEIASVRRHLTRIEAAAKAKDELDKAIHAIDASLHSSVNELRKVAGEAEMAVTRAQKAGVDPETLVFSIATLEALLAVKEEAEACLRIELSADIFDALAAVARMRCAINSATSIRDLQLEPLQAHLAHSEEAVSTWVATIAAARWSPKAAIGVLQSALGERRDVLMACAEACFVTPATGLLQQRLRELELFVDMRIEMKAAVSDAEALDSITEMYQAFERIKCSIEQSKQMFNGVLPEAPALRRCRDDLQAKIAAGVASAKTHVVMTSAAAIDLSCIRSVPQLRTEITSLEKSQARGVDAQLRDPVIVTLQQKLSEVPWSAARGRALSLGVWTSHLLLLPPPPRTQRQALLIDLDDAGVLGATSASEAIEKYRSIVTRAPEITAARWKHYLVHHDAGNAARESGQFATAANSFEQAYDVAHGLFELLTTIGPQALNDYDDCDHEAPFMIDDAVARRLKGEATLALAYMHRKAALGNQSREADLSEEARQRIPLCERAARLLPLSAEARVLCGDTIRHARRADVYAARRMYLEALQIDPDYKDARDRLLQLELDREVRAPSSPAQSPIPLPNTIVAGETLVDIGLCERPLRNRSRARGSYGAACIIPSRQVGLSTSAGVTAALRTAPAFALPDATTGTSSSNVGAATSALDRADATSARSAAAAVACNTTSFFFATSSEKKARHTALSLEGRCCCDRDRVTWRSGWELGPWRTRERTIRHPGRTTAAWPRLWCKASC